MQNSCHVERFKILIYRHPPWRTLHWNMTIRIAWVRYFLDLIHDPICTNFCSHQFFFCRHIDPIDIRRTYLAPALFPLFQSTPYFFTADIEALCPYDVYQVLAQLLDLRPYDICDTYISMFPVLLTPAWPEPGIEVSSRYSWCLRKTHLSSIIWSQCLSSHSSHLLLLPSVRMLCIIYV